MAFMVSAKNSEKSSAATKFKSGCFARDFCIFARDFEAKNLNFVAYLPMTFWSLHEVLPLCTRSARGFARGRACEKVRIYVVFRYCTSCTR